MQRAGQVVFLGIVSLSVLLGMSGPAASQSDTCNSALNEVSALPFSDSGSTSSYSLNDDYNMAFPANTCAGGGSQSGGTGSGKDVVYRIDVDNTCNLRVNLYPTSVDLALYVVTDCTSLAANCVGVSDAGGDGAWEHVDFTANSGTRYYIIVDGVSGSHGSYDLTIGETSSTDCSLISFPPPVLEVTKSAELWVDVGSDGDVNPGDTIRYTTMITNTAGTADGVMFSDTPDPNTALVVNSVTTGQGTVTSGNNPGDTSVAVTNMGPMPEGRTIVVRFQATVDSPLATQVVNQGAVEGANFSPLPTDDPSIPGGADATVTAVFPAQSNGASCDVPAQCESGFCGDGVCCDSACDVQGEVCDLPDHVGTCTIAIAMSDCRHPAPSASHTALLIGVGVLAVIGFLALYRRRTVAH